MIDSGFGYCPSDDEQVLFAHFQWCVDTFESPQELITDFRNLFFGEKEHSKTSVWQALGRIVDAGSVDQTFPFILNRCCYILINRWRTRSRLYWAIPTLIDLFDIVPQGLPSSWTAKCLRSLIQDFRDTEQYRALRRIAQIYSETPSIITQPHTQTLESLMVRYPFLYEQCLLTDDSTDDQRQQIRNMRREAQQNFNEDLSQYLAYHRTHPDERIHLPPVANPTLLSEPKFRTAWKHFTGRVDGGYTYQESAKLFLKQSVQSCPYRVFKEDLFDYLNSTVEVKYGEKRFSQRLNQVLQETLPHNHSQTVNQSLLASTCRKLFNFIVIESDQNPSHFVFLDLMSNLGGSRVIGMLLKMVLICRKVKADLEKRFAVLFNHYATFPQDQVTWLIESLETLNIAFSANFTALGAN
ncbi:MAG: hypothetical protein WBA13_22235 [Microcoleaceae cyanobacterium]